MMEKKEKSVSLEIKVVMFFITCVLLFWSWFFILKPIKNRYDIEVGDIYVLKQNNRNPFIKNESTYFKILDKKGDYIQYLSIDTKDTITMTIRSFLIISERVD